VALLNFKDADIHLVASSNVCFRTAETEIVEKYIVKDRICAKRRVGAT
jgi:hypothetical protein